MQRRIIICGLFKYPRGNACANYMQNLTKALIAAGYEVVLVCDINTEYLHDKVSSFKGAKIFNIMHSGKYKYINRLLNGKLFKVQFYLKLKTLNLNERDLIISTNVPIIRKTLQYLQIRYKFKICGYIGEWFSKNQFSTIKEAKQNDKNFLANRNLDMILPVSYYIEKEFFNSNAKSLVLPPLVDVQEYTFNQKKQKKYEFILPAMGMMKDALNNMILGISDLSVQELNDFKFHILGVSKDQIQDIAKNDWNKIKNTLVFHSWMKYEELISLYQQCHYLFLARDTNQMTLSNFPSKVPEVMTYGIVPVCSNVGDYTKFYLKDNYDSLIFEGCDRKQCSKAIKRAIDLSFDEYAILSLNARKTVEDKFDYHNWIDQLRNTIENLWKL